MYIIRAFIDKMIYCSQITFDFVYSKTVFDFIMCCNLKQTVSSLKELVGIQHVYQNRRASEYNHVSHWPSAVWKRLISRNDVTKYIIFDLAITSMQPRGSKQNQTGDR